MYKKYQMASLVMANSVHVLWSDPYNWFLIFVDKTNFRHHGKTFLMQLWYIYISSYYAS